MYYLAHVYPVAREAMIDIKDLPVGEESGYTAEFTPNETGFYQIYAYLYDGWGRIGRKTGYIYCRNNNNQQTS